MSCPDGLERRSFALPLLVLLIFLGGAAVAYAPSLHGPFILDDHRSITDNPAIRITRLDLPSVFEVASAPEQVNRRRALVNVSFAVNYYFGEYDTFGYRLVNLLIHILGMIAAFALTLQLARLWLPPPRAMAAAVGTAVLWGMNPLMTNGVSYVVQRMTSLSTLFSLVALAFFVRGHSSSRSRWYAAAGACWAAALLTKETAVLLPLVALLFLWLSPNSEEQTRRLSRRLLAGAVIASQAILLVLILTSSLVEPKDFTSWDRLLTEGRVILRYLSLFILPLPSRLNLDYDFPLSLSLVNPPATSAAWLLHCFILVAALSARRKRPLLTFAVLSYYLLQLLEGTVLPLALIFEHRAYLPSFFLALALVEIVGRITARFAGRRQEIVLLCFTAALGLLWGIMTFQRNQVWGDDVRLWEDVVMKAPGNARAHNNLGAALSGKGRLEESLPHFQTALELRPGFPRALNNAGVAYRELGRHDKAEDSFRRALEGKADLYTALINLGNILSSRGRHDEAVMYLELAVQARPGHSEAYRSLGNALFARKSYDEALGVFGKAVAITPRSPVLINNLAVTYGALERYTEAIEHSRRALLLKPEYPLAHYNLGLSLLKLGRVDEARVEYHALKSLDQSLAAGLLREIGTRTETRDRR